jgi:hypothetical protein
MKLPTITTLLISMAFNSFAQNIDFEKVKIQNNSELFRIQKVDSEQIIQLEGNEYDATIDPFTGMEKSNSRDSKVFLIGEAQTDYIMTAEMKFIKINLENCKGCGWFGFAIRAQDFDNFEAVWFMPGVDENNVAYIPIAHGIGPYWAEGYIKSEKGTAKLPEDDWFEAKAVVKGKVISIYVNNELVLEKMASYYLTSGYAGFFVGTATDAAFRNVKIEKIKN